MVCVVREVTSSEHGRLLDISGENEPLYDVGIDMVAVPLCDISDFELELVRGPRLVEELLGIEELEASDGVKSKLVEQVDELVLAKEEEFQNPAVDEFESVCDNHLNIP